MVLSKAGVCGGVLPPPKWQAARRKAEQNGYQKGLCTRQARRKKRCSSNGSGTRRQRLETSQIRASQGNQVSAFTRSEKRVLAAIWAADVLYWLVVVVLRMILKRRSGKRGTCQC